MSLDDLLFVGGGIVITAGIALVTIPGAVVFVGIMLIAMSIGAMRGGSG